MTIIIPTKRHMPPGRYRKLPWFRRKGLARELTQEIYIMKKISEEREEQAREEGIKEGITRARALTIEGYDVQIDGESWCLTRDTELNITHTIDGRMIVPLEEWMKMTIPVKIRAHTIRCQDGVGIERITVKSKEGGIVKLFHTNDESTCWGDEESPKGLIINKENLDSTIERFKELMKIINHYSTYTVGGELTDIMNYIRIKHKSLGDRGISTRDWTPEQMKEQEEADKKELERLKEKIIRDCPYVKKNTEEITT